MPVLQLREQLLPVLLVVSDNDDFLQRMEHILGNDPGEVLGQDLCVHRVAALFCRFGHQNALLHPRRRNPVMSSVADSPIVAFGVVHNSQLTVRFFQNVEILTGVDVSLNRFTNQAKSISHQGRPLPG